MDAQIEKVIAETLHEFERSPTMYVSDAVREAVQGAFDVAARKVVTKFHNSMRSGTADAGDVANWLRSLADGPQKGETT